MSNNKSNILLNNLLQGIVKSAPFVGGFLEQTIYGTIEGKDRATESKKLYDYLDSMQGELKSLNEIVSEIRKGSLLSKPEKDKIELLSSFFEDSSDYKQILPEIEDIYFNTINHFPLIEYASKISDGNSLWKGLGLSEPINIECIYVPTTLSEKSNIGQNNIEIDDNLEELLDYNSKINLLVLGQAGSGKSTLLKHTAIKLSEKYKNHETSKVPVFIHLPDIIKFGYFGLPIHEIMVKDFFDYDDADFKTEIKKSLKNKIKEGNVVILLDSLDEVPQSHLNEIKGWIESICSSMGDSKVILTSRPIDIAYGLRTFKEYEVEPFQHDKQNDFIKRWFKYYEEEDEGDKMIEYLDSSEMITVRGASKLSGTPLFLTMMCIQYRDKGEISKTPGELIENYTIILLRGKGGQAGIPSRRIFELKQTTLETIAFYLFAKDSDRFNLKNISKVIRDVHEDFGIPTDMPYVKGTLEDITLRSNILIDVKNVSWEFSHKVFLEFFVARYHYSIQCTDENYDPPWVTETDENIYRRYENIEYYFDNLMLQ